MASERSPRFSAPVRRVLQGLAILFVLWILASGFVLLRSRAAANSALDRLDAAQEQLTAAELLRGEGQQALAEARRDFETAHDRAGSFVLAPWKAVPLLRQNVKSVEALTEAAGKITAIAERATTEAEKVLELSPVTGPGRLDMLRQLELITGRAADDMRRVDLGPDFFLFGPLGSARDRFIDRLDQLRDALGGARALAEGSERLLVGPRRYLVLAANNAEMRAGSGMLLSAGIASFSNGNFSLGEFRPSADFNLAAGAVPLPPELQALWGSFTPSQEWRNLATTPRFDVTAPLAAEMWRAATGEVVDGVLAVDPVALRALLAAQGPINAAGRELNADNVIGFLLNDQYAGVSIEDSQAGRRDALGEVARAAVDTLNSRPWVSTDLVGQLGNAGRGRHVLAWARDPVEQEAWAAGGVDGSLKEDSLSVSLLNVGANKLDQFIQVDGRIEVAEVDDGGHDVTITLELRNEAPTGLPSYIAGPHPALALAEGEYQAVVAVSTPGFGSVATIDGLEHLLANGLDGPTKVAAAGDVRLARGATSTVTVRFRLPEGVDELRLEPSARVPPITWQYQGRTFQDYATEHLEW
jgi:uncharacterized protein DUF4012